MLDPHLVQGITVLSGLTGSFLLARHKRSGFIFYSASSSLTAFLSLWTELYGLVFLHLAYITLDAYGFIKWNKVENDVAVNNIDLHQLSDDELLSKSTEIELLLIQRKLSK